MRRRARGETIFLVAALLALAGIATFPAGEAPCRRLAGGDGGIGLQRQIFLVERQDRFDDLWASLEAGSPPPRIDWGARRVVALFAGEHPGNHRLELVSAELDRDRLELVLEESVRDGGPEAVRSVPYLLLEAPADRLVEVRWHSSLVTEVPGQVE